MNLADLHTTATVAFSPNFQSDALTINGEIASDKAAQRVFHQLNLIRQQANLHQFAHIHTESNFPAGAGIASSAAAFSALALAGATAAGLSLSQAELSVFARRGSGSACRSIPDGYCEWLAGGTNASAYATSSAPAEYWNLCDIVAIVDSGHKKIGSTGGHQLANTSPLQAGRVETAEVRFQAAKSALLERNLQKLGPIIEQDAVIMHGVMMSSQPPLYYWHPATLEIIHATQQWRAEGLEVYFTIDAGPNVHLICEADNAAQVEALALALPGVQKTYRSGPGGPAEVIG
jgi:diphosphomevalonate decarboxylase